MATSEMKCPGCGATMNHHADKFVYATSDIDSDGPFSGSVEEFYQCPGCGAAASRPESR